MTLPSPLARTGVRWHEVLHAEEAVVGPLLQQLARVHHEGIGNHRRREPHAPLLAVDGQPARDRLVEPGKLDNMVAGGLGSLWRPDDPHGLAQRRHLPCG